MSARSEPMWAALFFILLASGVGLVVVRLLGLLLRFSRSFGSVTP